MQRSAKVKKYSQKIYSERVKAPALLNFVQIIFQIYNKFARLMADDSILNCGIIRLLQLTPKILEYVKSKSSNSLFKYYSELLDEGEEDFEAKDVTDSEFLIVYKLEEIDVINK